MNYIFHFSEIGPYLPLLFRGLLISIMITVVAALIGTGLGLFSALARLSSVKLVRRMADLYVEVFRNTPLLVQMYLIYFGLGQFAIHVPATTAAIIAMTLNTGAYTTVIFQAGIQAVDVGHKEAAFALGMNFPQAFRHVILPPAFRIVFPPLVNQTISLFLFSAVASTIAVPELMYQTMFVDSVTWRTFEVFIISALIYFGATLLATLITSRFERARLVQ